MLMFNTGSGSIPYLSFCQPCHVNIIPLRGISRDETVVFGKVIEELSAVLEVLPVFPFDVRRWKPLSARVVHLWKLTFNGILYFCECVLESTSQGPIVMREKLSPLQIG